MSKASETIARFGPGESLSGIFTRPAAPRTESAPVVVIVNTGVGHKGSHHRLFVLLARGLAAAGYPVLRFDLSGLGDSVGRGLVVDRTQSDIADLRAALDWVEAGGHGEIVLLGLCSGADRSIVYAGQDSRVRGAILIDPTIPPTLRQLGMVLRERLAALPVRSLMRLIGSLTRRMLRRNGARPLSATRRGSGPVAWLAWHKVPAFLEAAYSSSVDNGVALLVISTSGVEQRQTYRERLTDAFPRIQFGDRLTLRHLEGIHHLFVLERERAVLIQAMADWLAEQFASVPATCLSCSGEPARLRDLSPGLV